MKGSIGLLYLAKNSKKNYHCRGAAVDYDNERLQEGCDLMKDYRRAVI